MKYITYSHRYAENIFLYQEDFKTEYLEILNVLNDISDSDIIQKFESNPRQNIKSISAPINDLIKERLTLVGWKAESAIFNDPEYNNKRWRLDFAKNNISVEVAFNHGEAIAWNLVKPVLASELNHVKKDIQTYAGIIICATEKMARAGNFDNAVGTYEKFKRYLIPMQNMLPTPILLIGLKEPDTFYIDEKTRKVILRKK